MPIYEYECDDCGFSFERRQRFGEAPIVMCPECAGSVRKVIHPVGIVFKGAGFYVTDNRANTAANNSRGNGTKEKSPDGDSKKDKKEEGGAEKKADAKPVESSKPAAAAE